MENKAESRGLDRRRSYPPTKSTAVRARGGAESEANVDVGPMEVEGCTGSGLAGSEVIVRVQGGQQQVW